MKVKIGKRYEIFTFDNKTISKICKNCKKQIREYGDYERGQEYNFLCKKCEETVMYRDIDN